MSGNISLYDDGTHTCVMLQDFGAGAFAAQANQHLIVHEGEGMLLDPGGHKVYTKVLGETLDLLGNGTLRHLFLSHQDPDVVAATNGWLMTTDAQAWCSALWVRFVPHFGLDRLVADRLHPIPDEGTFLRLGSAELTIVPAHFLHSCGNFQVYDPIAKILFTGDLGASLGAPSRFVEDFEAHLPFMEPFHRRYMASRRVLRAWADMVRPLDIETLAPQHGSVFQGKELVARFLDWVSDLECGIDHMADMQLPRKPD